MSKVRERDSLGNRMKDYENTTRMYLEPKKPIMIRLDGRAFHTYTKHFNRPFDRIMMDSMQETLVVLCNEVSGVKLGYTQSDEITLVLTDTTNENTQAIFNGNVLKIASVTASIATRAFNHIFQRNVTMARLDHVDVEQYKSALMQGATFDSRCWSLPEDEVVNCLIWRQQDAIRNSIQAVGQSNFSAKQLHGKSCQNIIEMLKEKGIDWHSLPKEKQRGVLCVKEKVIMNTEIEGKVIPVERSKWVIYKETPMFVEVRGELENMIGITNKPNDIIESTYSKDDCVFLLKDLTGKIKEVSIDEKEKLISSGVNYSEMITKETPLEEVDTIFKEMMVQKAKELAYNIAVIAEEIYRRGENNAVIVSLVRAGTPIGVLVKRYIRNKYKVELPHYSISIIRGKGIDKVALSYILKEHPKAVITFVDGWTGKGSITNELRKSISEYNKENGTSISDDLAVVADPAYKATIAGTKKDVCIPNACLNSTVSGLISRTIHNKELIGETDYHGAIRYDDLAEFDFTNEFVDTVEKAFTYEDKALSATVDEEYVNRVIANLAEDFPLADIHKVKLSIGEASRALLRRKPYILLVKDKTNPDLAFVLHMAQKRGVEVKEYNNMGSYECVALLK